MTFDQSSGKRIIYMDGLPVANDTGAQPLSGTSTTLLIGRSGTTYFDGSVDEVRVWNIARAAADINANYGQSFLTLPAVGLVANYSFNEGSGTTASDSSGNNNTATLEGNPQWTTTVVNPPAPPAFGSFSITITGGVDLTLKGLPGGLSVIGTAVFQISPSQNALDLTVNGTVNLDPVGNLLQLGGHLHYDDATGTPEIYGGFALQTGQLAQLQQLGINVAGTAVLLFNSTSNTIPNQTIAFPDKTTKTYSLPADSVSLQIIGSADFQHGGQDWFSLDGQLDAFFTFSTDASGTVHPELQVDFFGTMLVGPSTSPYLSFMGSGYLQTLGRRDCRGNERLAAPQPDAGQRGDRAQERHLHAPAEHHGPGDHVHDPGSHRPEPGRRVRGRDRRGHPGGADRHDHAGALPPDQRPGRARYREQLRPDRFVLDAGGAGRAHVRAQHELRPRGAGDDARVVPRPGGADLQQSRGRGRAHGPAEFAVPDGLRVHHQRVVHAGSEHNQCPADGQRHRARGRHVRPRPRLGRPGTSAPSTSTARSTSS